MRKLLKKLRYIVEFFGSLYKPTDVKPFVMQLKKLQDVFGYVNDVVTASQLEGISDEHCREDRECQRATGFVIGWHASQAATSLDRGRDGLEKSREKPPVLGVAGVRCVASNLRGRVHECLSHRG